MKARGMLENLRLPCLLAAAMDVWGRPGRGRRALLAAGVVSAALCGPLNPAAAAQEGVHAHILPDDAPGVDSRAALYSYSHDAKGVQLPGVGGRNVVMTDEERIFAVVLTSSSYRGATIDGVRVVELLGRNRNRAVQIPLDDTAMKFIGDPDRKETWYKAQLREHEGELVIAVWTDTRRLEQTTRNAFSIRIDDLRRWRAEKARRGGRELLLGDTRYLYNDTYDFSGNGLGWAVFSPADLDREQLGAVRPRYFVRVMEEVAGNWVTVRRPIPIGDSGYFAVYNPDRESYDIRRVDALPALPDLPRPEPLEPAPRIPTLRELLDGLPPAAASGPDPAQADAEPASCGPEVSAVLSLVAVREPAPTATFDRQHRLCLRKAEELNRLDAELQALWRDLDADWIRLTQQQFTVDDEDASVVPAGSGVDYSRYDRCPNGHAWDECDHVMLKADWLSEQQQRQLLARRASGIDRGRLTDEKPRYRQRLDEYGRKLDGRKAKIAELFACKAATEQLLKAERDYAERHTNQGPAKAVSSNCEGKTDGKPFPDALVVQEGNCTFSFLVRDGGALPIFESGFTARRDPGQEVSDPANPLYGTQIWVFESPRFGRATGTIRGAPEGAAGTANGWEVQAYGRKLKMNFGVQFDGSRVILMNFVEELPPGKP